MTHAVFASLTPGDFEECENIFTNLGIPHDRMRWSLCEEGVRFDLRDSLDDSIKASRTCPDLEWIET